MIPQLPWLYIANENKKKGSNGYRHATFTTLVYESQVEYLRKAFTKSIYWLNQ